MRYFALVFAAFILGCGADRQEPPPAGTDYSERMAREHRDDRPVASPAAKVDPNSRVRSQQVTYANIGGKDVVGHFAYPADAEGGLPAVLVMHEWWGLNDNIRSMADQLAAEGYAALALDFYGGQAAANPEQARSLMEAAMANPTALNQNIRQAHAFLAGEIKAARIGAIGWCLGGGLSLRAGLQLGSQLDAVVVYYGHVNADPAALKALDAPLLGIFGAADEGIPVESVRTFEAALKSLDKPAQIHVYEGAGHAFANPSGVNYKAEAATDAWQRALGFLSAHLKGG